MSDAWWDNTHPEKVGPGAQTADAQPREKKRDDTDVERHTEARLPAPARTTGRSRTFTASTVSTWGPGGSTDPFSTTHGASSAAHDNTPEEAEELSRHEKKLIPPKPSEPPAPPAERDADHEPRDTPKPEEKTSEDEAPDKEDKTSAETPEGTETSEETGWRSRLADAKEKAATVRSKTAEGTAPVKKVVSSAYRAVSPERGQSFSFLWACAASVVVSPQTFVALWDRLITIFGAPQWRSGPESMEWGLFHGLGVWFRSVLEAHWAAGTQSRIILLALVGVLPVLVAQFAEKVSRDSLRKWAMVLGYGFPVVFICSASYIPGSGFQTWTEVYITALCTAAWWGFSVSRTFQPGLVQFLLRIPLASVIVGIVTYSPGAAF